MKNLYLLPIGLSFLFFSCNDNSVDGENIQSVSEKENDTNQEDIHSMDEKEETEKAYKLGPMPVNPLLNSYGNDSIDVDGNIVYPSRDTIWLEE